jgi:hypothetical protein
MADTFTMMFDRPWTLVGILVVLLSGLGLIVMRRRLLAGLAKIVVHRPWFVVGAGMVLTLVSLAMVPFLKVSTSRTNLLDEENPYQKQLVAFLNEFGSPNQLIGVIEGGDPEERRRAADELAQALEEETRLVRFVFYKVDLEEMKSRGLLYLPLKEIKRLRALLMNPKDPDSKERIREFLRISNLEELLEVIDRTLARAMRDPDAVVQDPTGLGSGLKMLGQILEEMEQWIRRPERKELSVMEEIYLKRFDLSRSNLDERGYLADRKQKRVFLFVRPVSDSDETEDLIPLVKRARKIAGRVGRDHPGVEIGFTGSPALVVDEMRTIQRDMFFMTIIALLGTVALFALVFRSGRLTALAVATLCTGLLWSLGFAIIVYQGLNLLTSLFFAILIGLGIDFGIHIIARVNEERSKGLDPGEAVGNAIKGVGPGLLTGALTTAAAFYATSISEFTAFAELGIIAGTGLLLVLLASITLLPALLVLAPGPVPPLMRKGRGKKRAAATRLVIRWPVAILVVAALVTLPVFLRSRSIPFDYNITQMLPEGTESREYYTKMIKESNFSSEFVSIIAGSLGSAREMTRRLERLDTVDRVESITKMVPEHQDRKIAVLQTLQPVFEGIETRYENQPPVDVKKVEDRLLSIYDRIDDALEKARRVKRPEVPHLEKLRGRVDKTLEAIKKADDQRAARRLTDLQDKMFDMLASGLKSLKQMLHAKQVTADSLPKEITEKFVSRKGEKRYALYVYPKRAIWDRAFLGEFVKDAREVAPEATGFPVTYYEHVRMIKTGFAEAAFLAGLAILVMLLIDFSRERYVILGIVPMAVLCVWAYSMLGWLGAGVFLALGAGGMALFDRRAVLYTLLAIIPLTMGAAWMIGMMELFGINYNLANIVALPLLLGIGVVYSVHIIHRHREEHPDDMFTVVRHTGGAVTLAALTTMVGFGALITAAHLGARTLGITMVIGVATCLVTAVIVLPALLKIVPWRKVSGDFAAVHVGKSEGGGGPKREGRGANEPSGEAGRQDPDEDIDSSDREGSEAKSGVEGGGDEGGVEDEVER